LERKEAALERMGDSEKFGSRKYNKGEKFWWKRGK
jgi:hypothetical protein